MGEQSQAEGNASDGEEGGCAAANRPGAVHGGWAICAQRQIHRRLCSVQGIPYEALRQEQGRCAQPLLVLHGPPVPREEGQRTDHLSQPGPSMPTACGGALLRLSRLVLILSYFHARSVWRVPAFVLAKRL